MSRVVATSCAASGALLWGTLGPVVEAWSRLGTGEMAFARSVIAAVTLGVLGRGALRSWWRIRAHGWALLTGGVGLAGFQFAYFTAVADSGVALSTVISIGVAPTLTGIWTWLSSRRLSINWLVGTGIASAGVALLVLGGGAGAVSVRGVAWAVIAAAFFSAQALAIESIGAQWSSSASLAWMFAISAVIMVPTGGTAVLAAWHKAPTTLWAVVYLGVVTAGLAYWLFAKGIETLGAAAAVTISLLEPAGALLLAVVALREHQTPLQWLGTVLLIGCIPVVARSAKPLRPAPRERAAA